MRKLFLLSAAIILSFNSFSQTLQEDLDNASVTVVQEMSDENFVIAFDENLSHLELLIRGEDGIFFQDIEFLIMDKTEKEHEKGKVSYYYAPEYEEFENFFVGIDKKKIIFCFGRNYTDGSKFITYIK